MKYRVVFDFNCAYCKDIEADSEKEAVSIVRQRIENDDIDCGELDVFETYFNYVEEVRNYDNL